MAVYLLHGCIFVTWMYICYMAVYLTGFNKTTINTFTKYLKEILITNFTVT